MAKLTPRNRDGWTQVHVSFSTKNLEIKVTEEHLRKIFEKYGHIADVTVKKHMCVADSAMQSGYGFVYYSNGDNAVIAVQEMKSVVVDNISYDCSLSYKSELLLSGGSGSSVAASASVASSAAGNITNSTSAQRGKSSSPRVAAGMPSTKGNTTTLIATALPSIVNAGNLSNSSASAGQSYHKHSSSNIVGNCPSFSYSGESISNSSTSMSNPEIITRSLSRNSSSGKSTDSVSKSGVPRPPPLVTQFSQSRMTVQQNIRMNAPSPMASMENTPTSSPSYFMQQQQALYGMVGGGMMMIPPNSYPVGFINSDCSNVASSPQHISPNHHLQQQQQQQSQYSSHRSSPSNGSQHLSQHSTAVPPPVIMNSNGVGPAYIQQSSSNAFVAPYSVASIPLSANYSSSHPSYSGSNSIHMSNPGQLSVSMYHPSIAPHLVTYFNSSGAGGYVTNASQSPSPLHLHQQSTSQQQLQPLMSQGALHAGSLPMYSGHGMATMPVSRSPAAAVQSPPAVSQQQHQQQVLYPSLPPAVVATGGFDGPIGAPTISTASTPTNAYTPQYMMIPPTYMAYSSNPDQHLPTGTPVYAASHSFLADPQPHQQHSQYSMN